MTLLFYGFRSLILNPRPGHYFVFVLSFYHVHPDIMNIIMKYKCGMTVCDEMYIYS